MSRKNLFWSMAALAAMALCAVETKAATINWTGTTGDWSDPINWGGTLPTSSDDAYIANDGTADVAQGQSGICKNLYLGNSGSGQSGTVEITKGKLTCLSSVYVGNSGVGSFTQSGGSNTTVVDIRSVLNVGYNSSSSGTYNLSGTQSILSANYEFIGLHGSSGVFQQSGGTNIIKSGLSIRTTGQYKLSSGTMQISGGLANMGILDFDNGPGILNASANSLINLALPGGSLLNTGSATLNVGAGSLLIVPADFNTTNTFAHYNNAGMLHLAGTPLNIDAGQTISGWGGIGDHVNCKGTINGIINFANGFTISDSGIINDDSLSIDDSNSGMSGGNLKTNYQYVGYNATGIFDHSGGNNYFFDSFTYLYLGYNSGAKGTYNLSGTGLLCATSETIGYSGSGIVNQTSGTNTIAYSSSGNNGLILGLNAGSKGTYNLIGEGQLNGNVFGNETIGSSGTGIFNQSAGINTLTAGTLYLGLNAGSSGTYNLTGGILIASSISKGLGTAAFNFGGGTLQLQGTDISIPIRLTGEGGNANINTLGYTSRLSGVLSGPGGPAIDQSGQGRRPTRSATAGPTTITSGILGLVSEGSLASSLIDVGSGATFDVSLVSGGFNLASGQTLKGSGKIIGNLTINGIHAPGNSPGIETVQGNYNMLGQLEIELAGTTPGMGYDQVLISEPGTYNAALGGTLALDWTGLAGSSDSTQLWIIENDTAGALSGTFGNYANGSLLGNHDGRDWFLWYGADAATGSLTGGNDVVISAVPEPGVILLLLSAGLVISVGFFRRDFLKRGLRP